MDGWMDGWTGVGCVGVYGVRWTVSRPVSPRLPIEMPWDLQVVQEAQASQALRLSSDLRPAASR